jgi:hypothetical protein
MRNPEQSMSFGGGHLHLVQRTPVSQQVKQSKHSKRLGDTGMSVQLSPLQTPRRVVREVDIAHRHVIPR